MAADVLQFRNPHAPRIERRTPPRRSPPERVGYPKTTTLVCDDGDLVIDPAAHTFQQVAPHNLPASGEPTLYTDGDTVVLDLGDCVEPRTLLRLAPDAAETWGKAMLSAAKKARKERKGR